jgi:hypothetical protein
MQTHSAVLDLLLHADRQTDKHTVVVKLIGALLQLLVARLLKGMRTLLQKY